MSDTNYAEEPEFDPADFVGNEQRRSTARAMASLDADPEKAARAQSLSEVTGVNPAIIDGDQENFETQHRAALTASLLANNKFLSGYVDSHPLAAKISNDDYGQLDAASEAIQKTGFADVPGVGVVPTTTEPGERTINVTGSILSKAIEAYYTNADFEGFASERQKLAESLATNPTFGNIFLRQGVEAGATALEGSMRVFSGLVGGAAAGIGEAYKQAGGAESDANKLTRDLIVMAQVGLSGQAGLHGVVHPEVAAEISKFSTAVKPYLEAGKEPPVGIHPLIDDAKAQQAKIDSDNLSAALKESQASKTRERSPDMYADFVRQHTSGEIGISADAVRELYGNKVPAVDDGLLGFVPKLAEQLAQAEATGGDVKVPVADWLAKVEPEVAKQLEDHIRVRDGGMTVEETKGEQPPVGPVSDPVDSVRQSAALGAIDERKLQLERGEDVGESHVFGIKDNAGNDLGEVYVAEEAGGKRLYIDDIRTKEGPQSLGPRAVRQAADQLFEQFPNAEEIKGLRVSGAREVGGKFTDMVVKRKAKSEKQLELPQEGTTRLEDREAFAKASAIGMTVEQYKRYQNLIERRRAEDAEAATARAEADQRKRQTAEWKANRAELRPQVRDEVLSQPDHELDEMLRGGKVKLRSEDLTDEQRAVLPKEYVAAEGIHPDDLAGMFGGTTGRELVDRLATMHRAREASGMKPRAFLERTIEAETDRQMEAKYGKLDRNILEEAKDQVLSETQEELLHEQTMALAADAGLEFSISKEDLKAAVKANVDGTAIKNLSSDKFLADAGRAGRATEMALLKGNAAEAFRQSQRQYLAYQFAREARKIEKAQASFAKLAKRMSSREVASVDQEYTDWVHNILLRVGQPIKRSVQDLQESIVGREHKSLGEFVDYKQGHDMREVPVAEFLLDDGFKSKVDDLTAEQFSAMHDSIKTLVKNGADEKKITKAGEEADLDEIKSKMIEQLKAFKEKHYDAAGGRWLGPLPPRVARPLRTYLVSHLQLESIFNRWDRADPRGVFTQYVARELATAANGEAALERRFSRMLSEVADKADLREAVPNSVFKDPLSSDGAMIPMTRKNLRAVLLNAGNDSNFDKLAGGYGVPKETIKAWLDTHATKEDWQWAQKMGDIFAEIKKEADVMYRHLSGIASENIPLKAFDTPHGKMDGWYYPVVYHPVWEGTSKKLMGGDALEQDNYIRATTPRGYTKSRTGYTAPLALDIDSTPVRMRQMIHDIAFRPAVIQASKIFYDKDIRAAITQHYGKEYRDLLVPYLRDVANAANFRSDAQKVGVQVSEFIRQNIISTLIGLNPGTVLKHGPTAAINSMSEVGPVNFLKAIKGLTSVNDATGETNWSFAMKTSEELQRRMRHYQETLGGAQEKVQGEYSLRDFIQRAGSFPVAMSDLMSAVPTWMAKYEAEMNEHGVNGDAIFAADRAVRRAHGSSVITNRSAIMRGGPLMSWMTSVYGFFNHIMNRQYELMWKAGDTLDLVKQGEYSDAMKQVPHLTAGLFSYVILPALIEEMVTPLTSDKNESWGKKAAKGLAYTVSASWIGVRDIASAMLNGRDPSIGLLSTTYKTISDLGRDLAKDRPFSKQHAGAVIQHGATAFGAATGLMNAQVGKSGKFIYDYATGQERPKGPWAWLSGLRFGQSKGHSQSFDQYMKGH